MNSFIQIDSISDNFAMILLKFIKNDKYNKNKTAEIMAYNTSIPMNFEFLRLYIYEIAKTLELEVNTLIYSFSLIDSFLEKSNIKLTNKNVLSITITAISLAVKYLEDFIYDTKTLCEFCDISIKDFVLLEIIFLQIIEYKLYLSTEIFQQYEEYLTNRGS